MSLTLLPAVDVRDGKAVRLRQGESGSETDYGSPLEAARTWVEAGAELFELIRPDRLMVEALAYDPAQAAVGPSTPSWLEFSADNG